MSTSGGKRGGASSLEVTKNLLPMFGAEVTATFSLASYYENFDAGKGVTDTSLAGAHRSALDEFLAKL